MRSATVPMPTATPTPAAAAAAAAAAPTPQLTITRSRIATKLPRSCVGYLRGSKAPEGDGDGDGDGEAQPQPLDAAKVASLDLSGLAATRLHERALKGFAALRRLDLAGNELGRDAGTIPRLCETVPGITYLDVSRNEGLRAEHIATAVRGLTQLVSLKASGVDLASANASTLEAELAIDDGPAESLRVLVLDRTSLAGDLRLTACVGLEALVVSHNQLHSIDVRALANLEKLSASHNPALVSAPRLPKHPSKLAEIRLAHCEALEDLSPLTKKAQLLVGLKLLDLTAVPGLNAWSLLEGFPSVDTLGAKATPLRESIPTHDEYVQSARKAFPRLKTLDFAKLPPAAADASATLVERVRAYDIQKRRNLISNKRPPPDPRLEPCVCGSGKAFGECCAEKLLRPWAAATANANAAVAPADEQLKKRVREEPPVSAPRANPDKEKPHRSRKTELTLEDEGVLLPLPKSAKAKKAVVPSTSTSTTTPNDDANPPRQARREANDDERRRAPAVVAHVVVRASSKPSAPTQVDTLALVKQLKEKDAGLFGGGAQAW